MRVQHWWKTGTLLFGGVLLSNGCHDGGDTAVEIPAGQQAALIATESCAKGDAAEDLMPLPPPDEAINQIASLTQQHDLRNAARLSAMIHTPQAYWFTGGAPAEVEAAAREVMTRARRDRKVPILVAYNVPFRDCAQYSFGGTTDSAAYNDWIDAFARGVGNQKAFVILEPDSLGIIPYNTDATGVAEWCKPTVMDASGQMVPAPGASPQERFAQLNHAVDTLRAQAPRAQVYLDGTHSGWLSAGDSAARLVRAGVLKARGFFLNVSNFQPTTGLQQFGSWVSKCIYYANNAAEGGWRVGHYEYCASQYYPATVSDPATWALTDQWYADNVDNAANPPSSTEALTHFVLDTGRNGQGALVAGIYGGAPYNQPPEVLSALDAGRWCNPPNAGAGLRPTTRTDVPLVDAYLWVNDPGVSDGTCDAAGGARSWRFDLYNPWHVPVEAQSHFDPLWGLVNPFAGVWFPELALRLAQNAVPRMLP